MYSLLWPKNLDTLAGSSTQSLTRLKSRCWMSAILSWGLRFSSKLMNYWQESFPWGCRTEVSVFLLAVSHGMLLAPRDCLQLLNTQLTHAAHDTTFCFLLGQQESLFDIFSLWLLDPLWIAYLIRSGPSRMLSPLMNSTDWEAKSCVKKLFCYIVT